MLSTYYTWNVTTHQVNVILPHESILSSTWTVKKMTSAEENKRAGYIRRWTRINVAWNRLGQLIFVQLIGWSWSYEGRFEGDGDRQLLRPQKIWVVVQCHGKASRAGRGRGPTWRHRESPGSSQLDSGSGSWNKRMNLGHNPRSWPDTILVKLFNGFFEPPVRSHEGQCHRDLGVHCPQCPVLGKCAGMVWYGLVWYDTIW